LLSLDYGLNTLAGKPLPGSGVDLITQRVDGQLSLSLGLFSRAAIALRMPVLLYQSGDESRAGFYAFHLRSSAVGNPALDGRVRVWGAPVKPDGSVQDGGAFALRGIVWLPLESSGITYFTDTATRTELQGIVDVEMLGISAGATFGYRHRFDERNVLGYDLSDQLHFATGVRLPVPLLARAYPGKVQEAALLELDMFTNAQAPFEKATTPVEARLSYRMIVGDFISTVGASAGLVAALGSPDLRVLASFGWSPRKHDQDGDGVPDTIDECVHLPEDKDGFQDGDGCADDDNDGDLIVDEDDLCPQVAAEPGKDDDEDGCTDK
jgi:hypothetical protein